MKWVIAVVSVFLTFYSLNAFEIVSQQGASQIRLGGKYARMSGTSMAAPFITGFSALLLQKIGKGVLKLDRVRGTLEATARPGQWELPVNYG